MLEYAEKSVMCSGMGMKTNFGSKFWESSPKILGFLRFLFHVFAPLRSQYGKISSIKKKRRCKLQRIPKIPRCILWCPNGKK